MGTSPVAWRRRVLRIQRAGFGHLESNGRAMLDKYTRVYSTRILTPAARGMLKLGLGPDAVTVIGTLGVCAGALIFYPQGEFLWGTLFITAFVFFDNIDGIMARMQ